MRIPTAIHAVCLSCVSTATHAAPGDYDTSFGTNGRVTIELGTAPPPTNPQTPAATVPGEGSAITVQADGKIVAVGLSGNKPTVVRLKEDGSLDTTFNTTGKAPVSFGATSRDYMRDVAISSGGQISIGGYSNALSGDFTFALGRLNTSGAILGTTLSSGTRYGGGLAVQSDGRTVMGGHNVIARYTSAGILDPTFDTDGRIPFSFDTASQVYGIATQPDGKVVATGTAVASGANAFVTARYNANGSLDTSFGTGGHVRTQTGPYASVANRVAVLPGGKIVVAGFMYVPAPESRDFAVVRYHPDGSLDTTFNGSGTATASIGAADAADEARLAVQPDGKILVGGTTGLVRFNTNGTLDTSFSSDGKVPTDFVLSGIAMQPNGRIVLTGGNGKMIVARLLSGLAPDISVEQPAGTALTSDGSAIDFGTVLYGESKSLIFTVKNAGSIDLTGLTVTKASTGTPESFTLGTAPASTITAGGSATFTVSLSSTTAGTRTATLNIASNDPDENPFVIKLTARQASALETWRNQYFGSIENTGTAADSSDPDGDGVVNLMEFATSSHPLQRTAAPGYLLMEGTDLDFSYTRLKSSLTDLTFAVQVSSDLQTWGTGGLGAETILTDNGTTQQVKVSVTGEITGTKYIRLKVTRR